jgi:hypothetical protein
MAITHVLMLSFCIDSSTPQYNQANNPMKKVIAIVALAALASSAHAQLSTNPPASSTDGVLIKHLGDPGNPNAGVTHWDNTGTLAAYNYASDGTSVKIGTPDNKLGLNWGLTNANVVAALAKTNLLGGTIRVIFTGEDAGWTDSFGYSYSGNPRTAGSSFTVFDRIEANGPNPINIHFGDYADISFVKGTLGSFDFWYSAAGQDGSGPYTSPSTYGGVYTAFNPAASTPYNSPGNVKFAGTPLMVNTWIAADSKYENVATYLMSFEDWNLANVPNPSLIDYSDGMFALQFFGPDGKPFTPVPEPSTYGLIGAVALLGLVAARRFKARK